MDAEDEVSFREFAASRWTRLERAAFLLTGDVHLAEDLTQIALARAHRSWRRIQSMDNPDAYVRRILVNSQRTRLRRRRIGEYVTAQVPDTPGADLTAQIEQRQLLVEALAGLAPRQRAVIVLRYWLDLSEQETAEALGCSVGTVKSQSSKALARLRGHRALIEGRETPTATTAKPGRASKGGRHQ